MADDANQGDLLIASVREAFSAWRIWRAEYCYTAELRPTPTARHVVVSATLAGLSEKLGAASPARDGAR
jgi:hypothetical protein